VLNQTTSAEVKHLHQLLRYLRPTGRVGIRSTQLGQLYQRRHELRYVTNGLIPFTWPVTGAADFTLIWDESVGTWTCSGTVFGETPKGSDPKTWFHNAARAVKIREQILKGFLQTAMTLWERYVGDLEQFQYRLGIKCASYGHMSRYDSGYCWTHTTSPGIQVFFSPDLKPPEYGMPPRARFGFYQASQLHQWDLNVENLAHFRNEATVFSHEARKFCEGASACFGKADFSDVQD
jgi:hypothetical protein